MRAAVGSLLTGFALSIAACGGAESAADETEAALAAREYRFAYTSPDIPFSPSQLEVLQSAFRRLATVAHEGRSPLRRKLAAQTLARIEAGDVRLGSVGSARGVDRFHMCKDYGLPACVGAPPADTDRTWVGDEALRRTLEASLDGYQWGNRLYFTIARNTDPNELASTLVHEVNHVLNRSECSYYANMTEHVADANSAFVEEYRAFLAECYYVKDGSADEAACTAFAAKRVDAYGFARDLAAILPRGHPTELASITRILVASTERGPATLGRLVPDAASWPRAFSSCGR